MAIRPPVDEVPIRSADRVLRILDAVSRSPDGVTARDVADRLELSVATAYRLLGTLVSRDYLVRTPAARYILGRAVEDLGRAVHAQLAVTPQVRTVLAAMRDSARAPAYLTVFRGDDIAVAFVADSAQHPRIGQLHVGFTEAAHVTAFGKIMLADRDDAALHTYFERHGAAKIGPASVTSEAGLRAQLDDVRAQQIAIEVDEYMPDLACIAAPVRSGSGRTIGAVSLSTATDDFTSRAHELEKIVRRGAWHVSSSMPAR